MEYHVKNKAGETIASFEHEADRDVCYDALTEYWGDDCELDSVDE